MDYATIWILFGKLPIILLFACTMYCVAKQIGYRLTTWSFSAFFVSLSVGVSIFPSILGAFAMGIISLLSILKILSRQDGAWRYVLWPLTNSLLCIIAIGRLGCWLSGCCFGEMSDLPWAIQPLNTGFISDYHLDRYGVVAQELVFVHPVQLYESLGVLSIVFIGFKLRKVLGDVSTACFSIAGYLTLYTLINPLRAHINTPSSLVYYGHFSVLQLSLCCVITGLLYLAYWFRVNSKKADEKHDAKPKFYMKPLSLTEASILWISMSTCAGVSLSLGTPFSAQLGIIGVCLSAVAFIQTMHKAINRFESNSTLLLDSSEEDFMGHNVQTWAFFIATIPLCLLPLATPISARSHQANLDLSSKAWIYKLDKASHKLVRVGRVADLTLSELEALTQHQNYTKATSCAGPNLYLR